MWVWSVIKFIVWHWVRIGLHYFNLKGDGLWMGSRQCSSTIETQRNRKHPESTRNHPITKQSVHFCLKIIILTILSQSSRFWVQVELNKHWNPNKPKIPGTIQKQSGNHPNVPFCLKIIISTVLNKKINRFGVRYGAEFRIQNGPPNVSASSSNPRCPKTLKPIFS